MRTRNYLYISQNTETLKLGLSFKSTYANTDTKITFLTNTNTHIDADISVLVYIVIGKKYQSILFEISLR